MQFIKDHDLSSLLAKADPTDLGILIDLITDNGKGRISLSSEMCTKLTKAKSSNRFNVACIDLIIDEIRRFGGNTVANFFRGGSGISYKEIVIDVAKRVKAPHNPQSDCFTLETAIISKVMEKSLEKMSEAERKEFFDSVGQTYVPGTNGAALASALSLASQASMFRMTTYVANAAANSFVGRGLVYGASVTAPTTAATLAGPIGWALAAIWTAYDLSSPAYRVTVPFVIQIAYMRRKSMLNNCSKCGASLPVSAKFCSECGHPQA
ncbi:TPA: zinc-ribbon domain-containing protein [Pseudomonas aeruginosa]|uniref:zinc-ribbon domain-containing protein n=1 Tax=Pseudomonas aeruginosa TaxID=287 RepID=UPI002554862A|nr:zinc-ribbon domain-containing protein [Pseudomonas aeruginosa]MDK6706090.1 ubiquinol-cytochrome C chaperone family protein [Pseudomonas aeruginosa]